MTECGWITVNKNETCYVWKCTDSLWFVSPLSLESRQQLQQPTAWVSLHCAEQLLQIWHQRSLCLQILSVDSYNGDLTAAFTLALQHAGCWVMIPLRYDSLPRQDFFSQRDALIIFILYFLPSHSYTISGKMETDNSTAASTGLYLLIWWWSGFSMEQQLDKWLWIQRQQLSKLRRNFCTNTQKQQDYSLCYPEFYYSKKV